MHTPSFSPRRLPLAGAVLALLVATPGWAALAGKVNYVVGAVSAIDTDGQNRPLGKGDAVNSGDRLETGKGRLQIRFSDGSFLSLQPGTVFRIDQYEFDRNRPEQGSLLFNFARGGMRTVTGLIGRVNKANYKVRTPVASLGIRGTGYAATLDGDVLTLTVDKGIVNVTNAFGSTNVNAGQTFRVLHGQAPEIAPPGVSAEARARTPDDGGPGSGGYSEGPGDIPGGLAGNTPTPRGAEDTPPDSLLVPVALTDSTYPPQSSVPTPAYTLGSLFQQANGTFLLGNLGGYFNQGAGAGAGGLTRLVSTPANAYVTLLDTGNPDTGGLQFHGVNTLGALSWGEWTRGTAAKGGLNPDGGTITLGAGQYEPYIIGISAPQATGLDGAGNAVRLSYSLSGGTTARSSDGETGTLQRLDIRVTLDTVPIVGIDLRVAMNSTGVYTAAADGLLINNSGRSALNGFQITAGDLTAQGAGCGTAGCQVMLAGFFAGSDSQMGAVYAIDRPNAQITGVGGLALSGSDTSVQRLADAASPTYAAVLAGDSLGGLVTTGATTASFGTDGGWLQGSDGGLNYGPGGISANPATAAGVTHVAQTLSWGRWTHGSTNIGDTSLTVGVLGMHYLIGSPTPAGQLPSAQMTYSLVGGTAPTLSDGNGAALGFGSLQSGAVTVDFGLARAALNLGMRFTGAGGTSTVSLAGNGALSAARLDFSNLSVSVANGTNAASACTGCFASASGFVAGSAAQMVGLGYQVSGISVQQAVNGSLSGVAAFGNPRASSNVITPGP